MPGCHRITEQETEQALDSKTQERNKRINSSDNEAAERREREKLTISVLLSSAFLHFSCSFGLLGVISEKSPVSKVQAIQPMQCCRLLIQSFLSETVPVLRVLWGAEIHPTLQLNIHKARRPVLNIT